MKKLDQLLTILKPIPAGKILEVGVADKEYSPVDNFLIKNYPYHNRITALGIGDLSEFRSNYPDITAVSYDGKSFPFDDYAFDIAHANAVIEHVGPLEAQAVFLKEMARVSGCGMITTPNKYFPIETHTRIPLLHWLDGPLFDMVSRFIGKGWASGGYMHLLGRKDIEKLAKAAGLKNYRIIKNRFCGFTMTFSLIWFDEKL